MHHDFSQPSLYHSPLSQVKSSNPNLNSGKPLIGGFVTSPPLELQMAVNSTKRATIVGVVLDYYYKQIVQMPSWLKLDFCEFATVWAGDECPCTSEFAHNPNIFSLLGDEFGDDIRVEVDEIENLG
ncbi:hypothetical protein CASFOL_035831 [Castilleja foliolosa]|uniref:Uncharacterized protein n=1 Tax=Castilleja foliolosa TaxID=1961234 RepID=A0ABD3BUZ0_9LAMI